MTRRERNLSSISSPRPKPQSRIKFFPLCLYVCLFGRAAAQKNFRPPPRARAVRGVDLLPLETARAVRARRAGDVLPK